MLRSVAPLAALLCLVPPVFAEQVIFTEVMYNPSGTKAEYLELKNLTTNRIDSAKWAFTDGIAFTFPDFAGGTSQNFLIKEKERFIVSSKSPAETRADYPSIPVSLRIFGPWSGSLDNAGETVSLMNSNGGMVCSLNYGDSGKWSPAADGAGHSLIIINEDRKVDDWRNWRAGPSTGGTPGNPEVTVAEEAYAGSPEIDTTFGGPPVVNYNHPWKFWRAATDPDGANPEGTWKGIAFDETGWQGPTPGFFGHEPSTATLSAMIGAGSSFSTGWVNSTPCYYFRTTFNWAGSLTGTSFALDQFVDDGVIYWLNGVELKGPNLGRIRMNAGTAAHNTSASGLPGSGDAIDEPNAITGSLDGQLVSGTNVLCAEVHQSGTNSSDIFFGARLKVGIPVSPTVVINELKPSAIAGQGFVEFFNTTGAPIDLGGHYLTDVPSNLTKYQIPGSLMVPAGGLATVDFAPTGMAIASPVVVYLTRPDGTTVASAVSGTVPSDGRTLGRKPSGGGNWFIFLQATPGAPNTSFLDTSVAPAFSEVHFGTSGDADWVELRNPSTAAASVAGMFIASRPDLSDKTALSGSIAGGGFASFTTDFVTDGSGDLTLFLVDSSDNVHATAEVTRAAGRPSIQRVDDEWYTAVSDTRNAANSPARNTGIVISELMFNPPSDHRQGEFIELHNRSASTVNIGGWEFSDGVNFTIPSGTIIPAGGYLVVAQCAAYMSANYSGIAVTGDYGGSLGNSGDLIRLVDADGNMADKVDYKTGGDWPFLSDGLGSSMELIHPDMDNNAGGSWAASDETNKSSFSTLTWTGLYRDSDPAGYPVSEEKELHINLVGDGHILIDSIIVRTVGGATNLLQNGGALPNPLIMSPTNSGATGWRAIGNHGGTFYDPAGLHLVSTGPGDLKGNLAELDAPLMNYNTTYELVISARWISGKNRIVAQTWNRQFGTVFTVPVPNNLGTPGNANSTAIPAPAPVIVSAIHSPAVPRSTSPVNITATVAASTPLASVEIVHRPDNVTGTGAWVAAPMFDNGTSGDVVAGDGKWSANVSTYQTDGAIAQFYVRATATNGRVSTYPRDGAARPAMWIVDNTPNASDLLIQRFVMSERDRDALGVAGSTLTHNYDYPRMSNHYFNSTLIINERDIIYNAEVRKSGSPWTREGGNGMGRVRWKTPKDRLFRGREKSGADDDAGLGGLRRTNNRMVRYWLYLLGYPVPDAEYVQVQVNNLGASFKDDIEPTDTDFLSRYYPDAGDSELYEIDDAWYFTDQIDGGGNEARTPQDGNWNYSTTTGESAVYWHGSWPIHTAEHRYDYSAFTAFVKSVYNGGATPAAGAASDIYREKVERQFDVDRWAQYAAARGWAEDWDNFTISRGKNGFFYRRPTDGKFEFHHWDSDLAFSNPSAAVIGGIGGTTVFTGRPWVRRSFNYYLTEIYNKWAFNSPRVYAWLQGMEDMSPSFTIDQAGYKSWFQNRQATIVGVINQNSPTTPAGQQNFTLTFSVTVPPATVTAPTLTVTGRAPSSVFSVSVDDHPEGVFTWLNAYDWQIAGILVREGLNTLVVRSFDRQGAELHTQTVNTTKTGDAPPVLVLTADPVSWNLTLAETLTVDTSSSADPEGTPLTLNWSITPSAGVTVTPPSADSTKRFDFTIPGVYTITVMATDGASSSSTVSREVTVSHTADFQSFGDSLKLPVDFMVSNLEPRDNTPAGAWYSLEDQTGRLTIEMTEPARPLANPAIAHPLVTRDLPDSGDWTLQTEVNLETRQFGGFFTGLWLETMENGQAVRYAFGVDGGDDGIMAASNIATKMTLRRAGGAGAWLVVGTPVNVIGFRAWRVRIKREGNSVSFAYSATGGSWTTLSTQPLSAPATAGRGGIFVSTSLPTGVRVSFDYLSLSNPVNPLNNVLAFLRITEVMYNPVPGGAEFIELRNTGNQAISLNGVSFGTGQPFSSGIAGSEVPYTFGNEMLQPGEFIVVPENTALFRSIHGPFARLASPWALGNLSNGGERIVLSDNAGATIPGHDFDYDDTAPWPLSADGAGPSLEIIDWNGDYSEGTNWRASSEPNGSPGFIDLGPDTDGDGSPDRVEVLFGTNPNDSSVSPAASSSTNAANGHVTLTWPSVAGVNYSAQVSSDLVNWSTLQTVTGTGTWTDTTASPEGRRYYRISAAAP